MADYTTSKAFWRFFLDHGTLGFSSVSTSMSICCSAFFFPFTCSVFHLLNAHETNVHLPFLFRSIFYGFIPSSPCNNTELSLHLNSKTNAIITNRYRSVYLSIHATSIIHGAHYGHITVYCLPLILNDATNYPSYLIVMTNVLSMGPSTIKKNLWTNVCTPSSSLRLSELPLSFGIYSGP